MNKKWKVWVGAIFGAALLVAVTLTFLELAYSFGALDCEVKHLARSIDRLAT